MQKDSLTYDTLNNRPLPKWLTNQKSGLNTVQPEKFVMKEDNSLNISLAVTGTLILLVVVIFTVFILRKQKNQSL